jgi:23S rRNA (cytosine1962-C5)-methyltransferase
VAEPNTNPPRLRLRVTAAAESAIRSGHPWVYDNSIREQNRAGTAGELAVVFDRRDRFLALGLYDPLSPIRLRVLHHGKPATADDAWWRARLAGALERRTGLFDATTNGYRCLSGENDGWPGLVLDRYDTTYVLKLYSAVWLPRLDDVVRWISEAVKPERLVLRLSRNIQPEAEAKFQLREGQMLVGGLPSGPVVFQETGIRFEAEVVRGQKTGFFLDQRENRQRVEKLAAGREVLNAFSFSGGFSLYAARGGARSTTDLDISPHALESARRNFALNEADPRIAACRHECVQADTFDWLGGRTDADFELVILDPPSLAKREAEREGAVQAYHRLVTLGIPRLRRGGILVAASCSAHVTTGEFFGTVLEAIEASGRRFLELERTGHAPDHPATFPEASYLKCLFVRFEP